MLSSQAYAALALEISSGALANTAPSNNRRAVLSRLERSRILLMRRGFWAIRTLIFLGYYTRGDVAESIGYGATAAGWEARGSTVATVPLAPMLWVER